MPESSAVYQPTTVGYAYDNGRDTRGSGGIRSGFSRIISRHKLSSRKWLEWVLLSVSFCVFVAGLAVMIVNLVSADDITTSNSQDSEKKTPVKDATTEVEEHVGGSGGSLALGATMMLFGLFLGLAWVWLRFFRRSKSPRGGLTGGGGQMLGGLNPSTDLLVGSTSQYGPVLTELPSQMKVVKSSDARETPVTLPLSDQEEETHTLMQEPSSPPTALSASNVTSNQIPG
ncbi:uncharacterized protein LOC117170354 isoform X1 [Belonocnema kinseyi]|uniref:uncharacterized protein LOC117170354 isoform X1 n=1 Tax=Belonocnema kinseyi TaxID=2817044 RepID=UPI00143D854E|nr:uncharacterized protein LOC117170354 isoform X1 [Belonocnema kinseyi]